MKLDTTNSLTIVIELSVAFLAFIGVLIWSNLADAQPFCSDAAACRPASIEKAGKIISFTGAIEPDSAAKLRKLLSNGDTLEIDSVGGDRAAAIEIGNIIVERNIVVKANSYCLSACALYIFIPAKRKSLESVSFLWMHSPAEEWVQISKLRPDFFSKEEIKKIIDLANDEKRLYEKAGVDRALLGCIKNIEGNDPKTLLRVSGSEGDQKDLYREVFMRRGLFDFVAFSKGALEHYGVHGIEGYSFPSGSSYRDDLARIQGSRVAWIDGAQGGWCAPAGAEVPSGGPAQHGWTDN